MGSSEVGRPRCDSHRSTFCQSTIDHILYFNQNHLLNMLRFLKNNLIIIFFFNINYYTSNLVYIPHYKNNNTIVNNCIFCINTTNLNCYNQKY